MPAPRASRRARGGAEIAVEASTGPRRARTSKETPGKVGALLKRSESDLEAHLAWSLRFSGLPAPSREYRFHPVRRWRFDFAWPEKLLAVELEGGIYRGGGHSSVKGLMRDIEKHNAATMLGWRVLRFHGDQVRSGEALELIRQALGAATCGANALGGDE